MGINPKKKSSPISYRTLINTVIFIAVVLLVFFLLSKACEAFKNGSDGEDTESDSGSAVDTDESDDVTENNEDNDIGGDSSDDVIHIPITPDEDTLPPTTTLTEEELESALLTITQDMGADYIEKFHFLCDSSLFGLKSHQMLSGGRETDRVLSGVSSSLSVLFGADALVYSPVLDLTLPVTDAIAGISPEYLLVSVGSDDIKNHDDISYSDFKLGYSSLISAIIEASPETKVICMPLLPGSSGKGLNIYTVERYNKYIHEAAAECGAYYIDIASAFASATGYLRIDCDAGASCLNTTGLKRVIDLLRTYKIPYDETDGEETVIDTEITDE